MNKNYQKTITACFIGFIVQAIVNNFVPLLFLTFQRHYRIPLSQITILVAFNFGVQLLVDIASVGFINKLGYRASIIAAHVFSATGLLFLTVLPDLLPSAFVGILISVMIYAVGGGLLDILLSALVEACPSDHKEKAMSLLHSFYCWGHVGVVLLSTLFFHFFGIDNWKITAVLWSIIPIINGLVFLKVPIAFIKEEEKKGWSAQQLLKNKIFWLVLVMMVCVGACEQSVSQWASTFAEKGLGVSKAMGDLTGPMTFAILMGLSRFFFGKYGERIRLERFMLYSCVLCIISYLGIALLPIPQLALISCAICGLSVGIMWPGTLSTSASALPGGGTAMFALLALAGDLGCLAGPTLVGLVSGSLADNLRMGILAAILFPVSLLLGLIILLKKRNESA